MIKFKYSTIIIINVILVYSQIINGQFNNSCIFDGKDYSALNSTSFSVISNPKYYYYFSICNRNPTCDTEYAAACQYDNSFDVYNTIGLTYNSTFIQDDGDVILRYGTAFQCLSKRYRIINIRLVPSLINNFEVSQVNEDPECTYNVTLTYYYALVRNINESSSNDESSGGRNPNSNSNSDSGSGNSNGSNSNSNSDRGGNSNGSNSNSVIIIIVVSVVLVIMSIIILTWFIKTRRTNQNEYEDNDSLAMVEHLLLNSDNSIKKDNMFISNCFRFKIIIFKNNNNNNNNNSNNNDINNSTLNNNNNNDNNNNNMNNIYDSDNNIYNNNNHNIDNSIYNNNNNIHYIDNNINNNSNNNQQQPNNIYFDNINPQDQ